MGGEQDRPKPKPSLPVPYELTLKANFERYKTPPVPGGLLDQPHLLMLFFDIIEDESLKWIQEKALIEKRNKELQEANAKNKQASGK